MFFLFFFCFCFFKNKNTENFANKWKEINEFLFRYKKKKTNELTSFDGCKEEKPKWIERRENDRFNDRSSFSSFAASSIQFILSVVFFSSPLIWCRGNHFKFVCLFLRSLPSTYPIQKKRRN